jgi:DNA primase
MILLELAKQRGLNPKRVASTAGGEYHSECPNCGGTDRFYMHPNKQMARCIGYYRCRQCETHGDSIQFARDFLDYSYEEALIAVGGTPTARRNITTVDRNRVSVAPSLKIPPLQWLEKAYCFVSDAHALLLKQPKSLAELEKRGIPLEAVHNYKLGLSLTDRRLERNLWGLDTQVKENGEPAALWIPRGIIIPTLEPSGMVVRLKVRRSDWHATDSLPKYAAVSGSMNGLTIVGTHKKVVIVVESELDAYAAHHAVGDFASVIACGGCLKNVDVAADLRAKSALCLMICHDNDEAGTKMLQKWQRLYPNAVGYPTPIGKDIGEAVQRGLNLREWIIDGLPQELKATLGTCNPTHTQEQL